MAKETVIKSDISGKLDAATVTFGLEDTWYEIDLTEEEKKALEKALKPYLAKGRKPADTGEKTRVAPETTAEEREAIRTWAREQGYDVPAFGRIPKAVLAAYDEAHSIRRTYPDTGRTVAKKAAENRVVPETTAEERKKIRAWAKKHGYQVAERGQIPKVALAAYDKAHHIDRGK